MVSFCILSSYDGWLDVASVDSRWYDQVRNNDPLEQWKSGSNLYLKLWSEEG